MNLPGVASWQNSGMIIAVSAVITSVNFMLQGSLAINLADEGYLWYGAWRMLYGEIPMKHFQAYDPGRYIWVTMWFALFGDHGLTSLRIANALFHFLALTFGLLSARRVLQTYWQLIVAGAILSLWMYPDFKVYDHGMALAAVYFAVLLIENPSFSRHFLAGVFVGVAAFFGRNHGVYAFLAYFILIVLIRYKLSPGHLPKRLLSWSGGIVVGYSPMLFMIISIPGFYEAFWDSIVFLFSYGSTNIALPVPWPWRIHPLWSPPLEVAQDVLIGFLFLLIPIFYIVGWGYILTRNAMQLKQNTVFVAAILVGTFYAHYAFSRADWVHLTLAIHPFLIGLLAASNYVEYSRVKLLLGLGLYSLITVGQSNPLFLSVAGNYVTVNLNGDLISMDKRTAGIIQSVVKINSEMIMPSDQFLLAPNLTTLYPILGRRSPTWDIYFLFPETVHAQQKMIATLARQNTNWVLVADRPLDGREELRFKNTHSLLWAHLNSRFTLIEFEGLPSNYQLFKRK